MAILGQCKSWILGKDIFFQLDGFPGKKIVFSLSFLSLWISFESSSGLLILKIIQFKETFNDKSWPNTWTIYNYWKVKSHQKLTC